LAPANEILGMRFDDRRSAEINLDGVADAKVVQR
jgi:hypothetical protein